ncbi:MAG: transposase [Acidobacteria bacterium]|nr:transposase [Acidobacteriota bacterium]
MPRANRYIQPGYIYHLTHRCHNHDFLLRCRIDRIEYYSRLRNAVHRHRITLFDFCITRNHVHLLGMCKRPRDLSCFMQQLQGGFADYYNLRKNRSGSFWGGRFHCTMVEGGDHLWNCLRYIDLNMVRAGVVSHPSEWDWCGYREIVGKRERFCILEIDGLANILGVSNAASLAEIHQQRIIQAIKSGRMTRESIWTESVAVGSEVFVTEIASKNRWRDRARMAATEDGVCYLAEEHLEYSSMRSAKKKPKKWLQATFVSLKSDLNPMNSIIGVVRPH